MFTRWRSPRIELRWHLVLLLAGALVPALAFAVGLLVRLYGEERAAAEHRLVERARSLAAILDREFLSVASTLSALAASERLDSGDLRGFHSDARRVLGTQPTWRNVILFTPQGERVVTAEPRPAGGPADVESFSEVLRTGRPAVGNMALGALGRAAFPVRVPVSRNGSLKYVLTAVVLPDPLIAAVSRPRASAEAGVHAFVDRTGTIAAGAGAAAALVGSPVAADIRARIREAPQGLYRRERDGGQSDYVALSQAPFSGWTAMISLPAAQVEAPVRQSLAWLCAAGLVIVGAGCAAAFLFGRSIAAAIGSASAAAQALVHGEPPPGRPTSVAEVASLAEALEEAARLLKQRGEEREELLRRAEAAVRLRDDFLARASHELRTPLTVIAGHLALLGRRGLANDSGAAELVATGRRQADRMAQLIGDLLDVARLDAGQARLAVRPLDLKPLVAETVSQVRPLAEAKRVALVEAVPGGLTILGDPVNLEQVLINLLTNAIRHTPEDGDVVVEGADQGGDVELRVRDSGEGIPREHLERIFEPFYQVGSATGRRKATGRGTGLGLAIVQRIVELHGGTVRAESGGRGKGSTFSVRLPAGPVKSRAA
jgi:signal transduction histidine kinase